jgi:hypothetical protein
MNLKLLPYTSKGTVDIGAVGALAITPGNRASLPYPPGKVRVNGQYWPNGSHIGAVDAILTWEHRNRHAQAGWAIVHQDGSGATAGPEGTYTVEVLVDGAVKQTQTGLTATSYTYTLAQRTIDDPDLNKPVTFRITPINGALSGTPRTTDPFIMQA